MRDFRLQNYNIFCINARKWRKNRHFQFSERHKVPTVQGVETKKPLCHSTKWLFELRIMNYELRITQRENEFENIRYLKL